MSGSSSNAKYGGRLVVENIGYSLVTCDKKVEEYADDDYYLMSFTVQTPHKRGSDYLVIGRIETGGDKMVCFHSGDTLYEAVKGFCDRFVNKSHKLREDEHG